MNTNVTQHTRKPRAAPLTDEERALLNERDLTIMDGLAAGMTNREIGIKLHMRTSNIPAYRQNAEDKLRHIRPPDDDEPAETPAQARARIDRELAAEERCARCWLRGHSIATCDLPGATRAMVTARRAPVTEGL
jgi:DNA-binding CsgD family transcriptional regulator